MSEIDLMILPQTILQDLSPLPRFSSALKANRSRGSGSRPFRQTCGPNQEIEGQLADCDHSGGIRYCPSLSVCLMGKADQVRPHRVAIRIDPKLMKPAEWPGARERGMTRFLIRVQQNGRSVKQSSFTYGVGSRSAGHRYVSNLTIFS
jgi:hypothetical protein